MENKKLALYFGVTENVIGVRECLHDWQEEDVIWTDGVKTEIYAVFESTLENMMVLATMFKTLNTNTSMWCLKPFVTNPKDEDEMLDNADWIDFLNILDLISVMRCNQWTMKKRPRRDFEKILDYMEECVDHIA